SKLNPNDNNNNDNIGNFDPNRNDDIFINSNSNNKNINYNYYHDSYYDLWDIVSLRSTISPSYIRKADWNGLNPKQKVLAQCPGTPSDQIISVNEMKT